MITLQIDNPNIEKIFLEDFNSNKEEFLKFIENSYNKMKSLESFERSLLQAKLQESGELEEEEIELEEIINEIENSSNSWI